MHSEGPQPQRFISFRMCRRCITCQPMYLRVAVMFIVGLEMLHDSIVLGLVAWRVVLTSVRYETDKTKEEPDVVVMEVAEVILRSLDLVFTMLLLYGVIKENRRYITAWWWWTAASLALAVAVFIWVAVYMAKHNHLVGVPIAFFSVIVGVTILFLVVVRNYVKYLHRRELLPKILINEDDDDEDI